MTTQNLIVKKKAKKKPPTKQDVVKSQRGHLAKKAVTFLKTMQDEFSFEPAREFMLSYLRRKDQFDLYWADYEIPKKRKKMSDVDIADMWRLDGRMDADHLVMLRLCYPTLRSTDVKLDTGVTPIININLGPPEKSTPELKSAKPVINIDGREINEDGS